MKERDRESNQAVIERLVCFLPIISALFFLISLESLKTMIRRIDIIQLAVLALTLSSSWQAMSFQQATPLRVPSVPHTGSAITMRTMPSFFRHNKKHYGNSSSLKVTANPDDFGRLNDNDDKEKKKDVSGPNVWPCGDELDKRLMKIAIPMILAFMVTPLMGAIDLFFVSRMANPLAVAGQAASNQIYNTAFWLTSFLPSGT